MNIMFGIFNGENVNLVNGEPSISLGKEEENLLITYDGEFYNSEELRAILQGLGYRLKGESDSELIANAYQAWGEECPKKFNGAFSFCIYDKEKETLFLARDQAGKKFLYYSNYNGKFLFSSQVKSIIETPRFPREIDLSALNFFFALRCIPVDLCIFKYIKKLPAGCSILFNLKSKETRIQKYWDPPISEPEAGNENELLDELEGLLEDATRVRMRGDAPVGAFLSGGLDSSLVVALMSKLSSQRIKTFSVGFRLNKYNELPYSRIVARYFGTDHKEVTVEPNFDSFLESASIFDEPLGDPSIFPTFYGAKLAGEDVNVVLSGDGADSLFLGTKTHRLTKRYGKIRKFFVPPIDWISGRVAELVPEEAKWRIFIENLTPEEFFTRRELLFGNSLRRKLFQDWVLEELKHNFDEPDHDIEYKTGTLTERMMFAEFYSHRNNSIFKVETTARSFSLNVRSPFLDTRVVEFAFSKVPGDLKIRGNVTKYLLKQLARKFLPPDFPFNRKQGLNPPFSEWLRNEWRDYLWDILMSGEERYLDRKFIRKLVERHKNPAFDQGRKLFALLVFKIWERKYLSGDGF
ncbi:MAG TPA: asparagine synthase (glutamine-hydrolyzing) [Thermodesulfobacteriota bacterium]|nr:asparagine synthase (glutamine-hydrolyzing) [Thermodesulfobacteriota bacterium]